MLLHIKAGSRPYRGNDLSSFLLSRSALVSNSSTLMTSVSDSTPPSALPFAIERVDDVSLDCNDPKAAQFISSLAPWRSSYGFECLATIERNIHHGISEDGKWFVLDRYPIVEDGGQPQITLSKGQYHVVYTDYSPEATLNLRCARGSGIHELTSERLDIFGLPPIAQVSRPAVIKTAERWIMFFEALGNGCRRIAVAQAEAPSGPWFAMDPPFLTLAHDQDQWDVSNPVIAATRNGNFLFYRSEGAASHTHCIRLYSNDLGAMQCGADTSFARTSLDGQISAAFGWGTKTYVYLRGDGRFRRATLRGIGG